MNVYCDTSFLCSIYCDEVHSVEALEAIRHEGEFIFYTALNEFELQNAIRLKVFRKDITEGDAVVSYHKIAEDIESEILVRPQFEERDLYRLARELSRSHTAKLGCRALDILHVAAALLLKTKRFFTFDQFQAKLARAEGLKVLPKRR